MATPMETLEIIKSIEIAAPPDVAFAALLEEMGPASEMMDGKPFPMVLEPRPGGRWFRDLGNDAGHFWGHVQVIKPPALIEVCGPMFMSVPALNHLQYRLAASGAGTLMTLTHRAIGMIPTDLVANVHRGWEYRLNHARQLAERRHAR